MPPQTTTPTTVTSGQVMPLTLTRSSGSFKGYLITAEGAVLTISSSDGKSKSCSGKGAITHSSSGGQGTVTATLTAPTVAGTYSVSAVAMSAKKVGFAFYHTTPLNTTPSPPPLSTSRR